MPTNPYGPGVSRFIDDRDRQFAGIVFQKQVPPLDSELNLITLMDLESRAETVRSRYPSGWLVDPSNPYGDYKTDPSYSNQFYFGRNTSAEVRNLTWAIVNGWTIPVAGTRTGSPPLAPDDVDTWNRVALNPPSTSTGGSLAEFVFLEVWQARIDPDPAPPTVAPGKPQRGSIWRFGNVEGGFSFLPDDIVDPDLNYPTTRRVQLQYRIRVVPIVNLTQNPEGFDKTTVFAQGLLATPLAGPAGIFYNMRGELGDPGLWRAGTGDPATFGTADGYVYAIPMCVVFRRNSAGFSDVGNLAGAFSRNSIALDRNGATAYASGIVLPADLLVTDTSFTLTSITGTVLSTMTAFGEAYFRIDDEIITVNSVIQTGPTTFVVNIIRGALQTVVRGHKAGAPLTLTTVRPDGLFADQVVATDILDLRHVVSESFDYGTMLKTNLTELLKGNLRTAWKRYGSTAVAGAIVLYGDRITDSSVFVGGLSRLDGPNGNRRAFSDAVVTERYSAAATVPSDAGLIGDVLTKTVAPYTFTITWENATVLPGGGLRLNGGVDWWWNGDQIRVHISDFQTGLPVSDADQVRFVLPNEDADAVLIRFEGMTTDPNGGLAAVSFAAFPVATPWPPVPVTAPTVTHPTMSLGLIPYTITGNGILKHGQGTSVSIDPPTGDLIIRFNSGPDSTKLAEFNDAMAGFAVPTQAQAVGTIMHIQFAVVCGAGRGLSHKPKHMHTVNWLGSPGNSSKVMLRPGLVTMNRMIPTYLGDSPLVQTGKNRTLARTSEVMIDPGSKTAYVAPYRNILVPDLLVRSGYLLNWYGAGPVPTFQGPMPQRSQDGSVVVHPVTDPLTLFHSNRGVGGMAIYDRTRYVEVPIEWLPRPGLHHIPIIPITNSVFPSGLNFLLMSKEGPFVANTSDWNRNLVTYPAGPGFYIVTPIPGETYGQASGALSIFGQKYSNSKIALSDGTTFKGIQFPPFLAPARITGVYLRDPLTVIPNTNIVPALSPFDNNRVFVGGGGTDTNLLRDDCDAATVLLDVDINGDLTFVLSADAVDLNKAPAGTIWDTANFLVECTLIAFDRGFLQTNGRLLVCQTTGGGGLSANVNDFTSATDAAVGLIVPAPMTFDSTNNEVTFYYSRMPYQGDTFGTQNAYSDDPQRVGPLTASEATSIFLSPLGAPSTLTLKNKTGFEVLASMSFVTSLGTGRLSGSTPIPMLSTISNPDAVPDYSGTLVDLDRRFSLNRVGYEDWATPKFPVVVASVASRPETKRGAMSEVYDRDLHPEFAGCINNLPLGIWFRDKDFLGKTMYQTRSMSNAAIIPMGVLSFQPFQSAQSPAVNGTSRWEGVEFVCGNASNVTGNGGEALIKVDGTSVTTDTFNFKTTRGGAAYSVTEPWAGSEIAAKVTKAKPNAEVGAVLAGVAYLVRSQPEATLMGGEIHAGHELQMFIVTQASPAYFRETEIIHSAAGVNEGYTAVDRFRIWGRPLEKHRLGVDTTMVPTSAPIFVNDVWDDPTFFGSSDPNLTSMKQEVIPISVDLQTFFPNGLSQRPLDPIAVQAWLNGVKLTYGIDYTVGGPPLNRDFTYIPTGMPLITLKTTDVLEIWFIVL